MAAWICCSDTLYSRGLSGSTSTWYCFLSPPMTITSDPLSSATRRISRPGLPWATFSSGRHQSRASRGMAARSRSGHGLAPRRARSIPSALRTALRLTKIARSNDSSRSVRSTNWVGRSVAMAIVAMRQVAVAVSVSMENPPAARIGGDAREVLRGESVSCEEFVRSAISGAW